MTTIEHAPGVDLLSRVAFRVEPSYYREPKEMRILKNSRFFRKRK
jgi:hypothetical protein